MLFNSLQFAIFFIIVYGLYLALDHKRQNRMLLMASYIFYGAWDWRFLSLIFISTILDYICGLKIYKSQEIGKKRLFLFFSIFGNISILGFFKYFNFFASTLQVLLNRCGISIQPHFVQIILPIGISFYTFQTLSYTIDIYRNEIKPTEHFFDFALFVAFFPQLVAGPIERAKHLLPQILSPRKFRLSWFYEGSYLIFWGLYQKIFVADNLGRIADSFFATNPPYNGVKVLFATYAFAFQIFCDFAGYSNIARGLGRLMGFDIMINFKLPYFVTNPRDFWRKWHISLSSWLKDYLYIPLGGSKKGPFRTYRNLAITMLLGGLWHGASWKFAIWGVYHGVLLIIYRLLSPLIKKIPEPKGIVGKKIFFGVRVIFFFHLICLGWIIFRAQSMEQALNMLDGLLFNFSLQTSWITHTVSRLLLFGLLLLGVQIFQYTKKNLMAVFKLNPAFQFFLYLSMLYSMLLLGVKNIEQFIYFQF